MTTKFWQELVQKVKQKNEKKEKPEPKQPEPESESEPESEWPDVEEMGDEEMEERSNSGTIVSDEELEEQWSVEDAESIDEVPGDCVVSQEVEMARQELYEAKQEIDELREKIEEEQNRLQKEEDELDDKEHELTEHQSMMKRFGKVIEMHGEYKDRVSKLTTGNQKKKTQMDIDTYQRVDESTRKNRDAFDGMMSTLLKNISPKTVPILLSEKDENGNVRSEHDRKVFAKAKNWGSYEPVGMTNKGFATRSSSRYSNENFRQFMDNMGKEATLEMLDHAMQTLEDNGFRTRKRGKERLQKVKRVLEKHWDGIIGMNSEQWKQSLDAGNGTVRMTRYTFDQHPDLPEGFTKVKLRVEADRSDVRLIATQETKNETRNAEMEYPFSSIQDDSEVIFAFSNIVGKFSGIMDSFEKKQKVMSEEAKNARENFRKEFATELLVHTTQKMAKGDGF